MNCFTASAMQAIVARTDFRSCGRTRTACVPREAHSRSSRSAGSTSRAGVSQTTESGPLPTMPRQPKASVILSSIACRAWPSGRSRSSRTPASASAWRVGHTSAPKSAEISPAAIHASRVVPSFRGTICHAARESGDRTREK